MTNDPIMTVLIQKANAKEREKKERKQILRPVHCSAERELLHRA